MAAFHTDADLLMPEVRLDPAVWHTNLSRTPVIGSLVRAAGEAPPGTLRVLAADTRRLAWPPENTLSGTRAAAVGPPPLVVAGDAAMAFDPLSSQGILSAMQSGEEAVPEILAWVNGDATATAQRSAERAEQDRERWSRYIARLAVAYEDERRWQDAPFWVRRHSRPWNAGSGS